MIVFELLLGSTVGLMLFVIALVERNQESKREVGMDASRSSLAFLRCAGKESAWNQVVAARFIHASLERSSVGCLFGSVLCNKHITTEIPVPCSLLYPSCCSSSRPAKTSSPRSFPSCPRSSPRPCYSSPSPSCCSSNPGSSSSRAESACLEELQ